MEMKARLLGLAGYAGAGKDTVAAILLRHFGYRRLAVADPLKEHLRAEYGLTQEQLHGTEKDLYLPWLGCSPRELFLRTGTAWREESPPRLMRLWGEALAQQLAANELVVVPDIRRLAEAQVLRDHGGQLWVVRRGAPPLSASQSDNEVAELPKEAFDRFIENESSLEQLERVVYQVCGGSIDPP